MSARLAWESFHSGRATYFDSSRMRFWSAWIDATMRSVDNRVCESLSSKKDTENSFGSTLLGVCEGPGEDLGHRLNEVLPANPSHFLKLIFGSVYMQVQLYVYDLSQVQSCLPMILKKKSLKNSNNRASFAQGMARMLSHSLTGRHMDGIWYSLPEYPLGKISNF